jgi:hypothetical protein
MTKLFHSHIMRHEEARFAYPVVHLTFPNVSLAAWLAFAKEATRVPANQGGLVAVRDSRDHIHALFQYRVEKDLSLERVLKVANLIVARLPGQALSTALIEILDELAQSSQSGAICVEVAPSAIGGGQRLDLPLSESGYLPHAISMLRHQADVRRHGPALIVKDS